MALPCAGGNSDSIRDALTGLSRYSGSVSALHLSTLGIALGLAHGQPTRALAGVVPLAHVAGSGAGGFAFTGVDAVALDLRLYGRGRAVTHGFATGQNHGGSHGGEGGSGNLIDGTHFGFSD